VSIFTDILGVLIEGFADFIVDGLLPKKEKEDPRTRAARLPLLGGTPSGSRRASNVLLERWAINAEARLWVGAMLWRAGSDAGLSVGVFRGERTGLELLAVHQERTPLLGGPLPTVTLNLDPNDYQVSRTEAAFGVLIVNGHSSRMRSSYSTTLHLYRFKNGVLSPIFAELYEAEKKYVVSFSPHQTAGFFDLLLSTTDGGKARRYIWTGEKYEKATAES
jgi:hypothetical protein